MTEEDLAAIAKELIEAFNAGDRDRFKRNVRPDVIYDEVASQRRMQGADAWVEAWEGWRKAFPDVRGTIAHTFVSGNMVVQEITWQGTQTGPLVTPRGSIPASGKPQTTRAAQVLSFSGDKVRECRNYFDMLHLLQQIGAMAK
jgi:steroid delta-isomerase-like uncharacterized protein